MGVGATLLFSTCVLYLAQLRDLLLSMARTDLFAVLWTDAIHDEWIRNLVKDGADPKKLAWTRELTCAIFLGF